MLLSTVHLVVALVIFGLALWALQQIPMDPTIARIIRVIVIVAVCIFLIYWFLGLLPLLDNSIRR